MASPPYAIDEATPASSDLISAFPAAEQTFRDNVESWLLAISTTSGVLKASAFPSDITISSGDVTITDGDLTVVSTSAGTTVGPSINLYRNSASPEDGDTLGEVTFQGEDSAGNTTQYARLVAQTEDVTNGTEDGVLLFQVIEDGTSTTKARITVSGLLVGAITALIDPTASEFGVSASDEGLLTVARSGDLAARFKRTGAGSVIQIYQSTTVAGVISVAGNETTYGTSSDGRLKEDFLPFRAGNIIDDIMVWNFLWSGTEKRAYGVVAQEVEPVFPDAVAYDDNSDTYMVDYSKFVPLLLQEIKDLRERVAALEG